MSCTKNDNEDFYHGKDQSDSASDDDGSSAPGRVRQLKKGPWTAAEDAILVEYVKNHGEGNWNAVQKRTTLLRCGKSCRLRWANHLRPNLKKGAFTAEEERLIIELHAIMGNKWARMAQQNDPFEKVQRPFSVNIWNETDRNKRNAPPPQRPDGHALQNGNFSASKPLSVAMKTELPSFQSFDSVHNNMDRLTTSPLSPEPVDTFIQSPPELSVQPCCTSPCGSGLLQDLIPGCSVPSSSTMPAETIDHYAVHTNEPISRVDCFPVLCGCNLPACCSEMTPSIADGIHGSIKNSGGVEHVSDPKSDKKQASTEDLDSVDANYETMFNWYNGRSEFTKEGPIITDGIACFLDDDLWNYKQPDSESLSMMKEENVNESPGLSPLSWFKMPAICQMPDSSQE